MPTVKQDENLKTIGQKKKDEGEWLTEYHGKKNIVSCAW